MLTLLTDYWAARQSALNLASRAPPRLDIESQIKDLLIVSSDLDTSLAWVRGHTGTPGNVKADARASIEPIPGQTVSLKKLPPLRLKGCCRAAQRKVLIWKRHALAAYT